MVLLVIYISPAGVPGSLAGEVRQLVPTALAFISSTCVLSKVYRCLPAWLQSPSLKILHPQALRLQPLALLTHAQVALKLPSRAVSAATHQPRPSALPAM